MSGFDDHSQCPNCGHVLSSEASGDRRSRTKRPPSERQKEHLARINAPGGRKPRSAPKMDAIRKAILSQEGAFTPDEILKMVKGVSIHTVRRLMTRMEDESAIRKLGSGRWGVRWWVEAQPSEEGAPESSS